MRLIGCMSVFLCAVLLGLGHKLKLQQRSRQWQEMQELLRLCAEELQISQKNSDEILNTIWSRGFHSSFLECYMRGTGTVQQRLHAAAQDLNEPMLCEVAQAFTSRFGMTSLDLQLEMIQHLQKTCTEEYEHSHQAALQDGKIAMNLGLFGGAAVAVILL